MPISPKRRPPPHPLLAWHEEFVRACGEVARVRVETDDRPEKIDHVWIDVRAGDYGMLQLSLSTCSRQSLSAGFDPRVWVGIATSTWDTLPELGIFRSGPLDYATLAAEHVVDFVPYHRTALEELLLEKVSRALCAEAWGDLYARGNPGVHQIHSRRGSFAMPEDRIGRDGALQLYYQEGALREMLLFKFAGQP